MIPLDCSSSDLDSCDDSESQSESQSESGDEDELDLVVDSPQRLSTARADLAMGKQRTRKSNANKKTILVEELTDK